MEHQPSGVDRDVAFSLADLVSSGRGLRRAATGAETFEQAADGIVRFLYDDLRAPDGERACALVRCFRTQQLGDLRPEARAFAEERLEPEQVSERVRCLVLAATAGDEPDWNHVSRSRGHVALPLPSPDVVRDSPMIARLLGEFGIDPQAFTQADAAELIVDPGQATFNVFHVEDAVGSPFVPAQAEFVERYGIRSVLGFGATLADGELFAFILFSRARIPRAVATRFEPLALHARTALLPFGSEGPDAYAPLELRAAALEELLDLEERVVTAQARALEERARSLRLLARAAVDVHAARDLTAVLDRITRIAREVVPAKQAVASLTVDENWAQAITAVDLHDDYAAWRDYEEMPDGSGIYATVVCAENQVVRMTQEELEAHPAWKGFGEAADRHPPMRGWLAAPLVSRDGSNLGLIQLSDREAGDFTAEDEYALVQLAQLGSLAIENIRLAEAEALQRGERFREELLAGISHDMKTPMVAIVGLAEALEDDEDLTPAARERTRRAIVRQARSLQNLVLQFLDFTRLEAGRTLNVTCSPTRLEPVVRQAVDLMAHLREVRLELDEALPPAHVDERRVSQVLSNLLSNAVKFSPPGSEVVVAARQEGGDVTVSVRDHGVGLRPEEAINLFQKFYRAENAAKVSGSGLGLYVSRLLAEAMGGTLSVDSTPGAGSTFTLRVPVATAGPATQERT